MSRKKKKGGSGATEVQSDRPQDGIRGEEKAAESKKWEENRVLQVKTGPPFLLTKRRSGTRSWGLRGKRPYRLEGWMTSSNPSKKKQYKLEGRENLGTGDKALTEKTTTHRHVPQKGPGAMLRRGG